MKSGIYKILNLINGKIYIGSAINIQERWYKHKSTLNGQIHHNKHLQASWNKYWEINFKFEVLEYCEPEKLIELEQYWIDNLKPQYNKRKEARSNLGVKRSEESKIKSSISNKGKKHKIKDIEALRKIRSNISQETRLKMSQSAKKRKHSAETKAKVSEALRKRIRKPKYPITQVNLINF